MPTGRPLSPPARLGAHFLSQPGRLEPKRKACLPHLPVLWGDSADASAWEGLPWGMVVLRGHQSQRAVGSPWERSERAAKTSPGLKAKAETNVECRSQRTLCLPPTVTSVTCSRTCFCLLPVLPGVGPYLWPV